MSGSTAPKFDRSSEQLQGTATSGLALSRPGAVSAGIWVLVLAAAVGLGIALLGGGAQARSIAQLACFVVLLVLVARLSFVGIPVPRAVWLGAACAGLSGFALRHVALGISEHAFVVAQLQEDTLGAEAKIVRDRMRSAAVGLSFLSVGTLSKKISTRQEAESVLRNERSVDGTVWGSPRWLNVTLRMRPPLSLKDMQGDSYAKKLLGQSNVRDLLVVTSVSGVGISNSRLPATGDFLGRLAEAWEAFPEVLVGPDDDGHAEMRLRSLAALKAPWTSNAHRALPMWMTGTYHLMRAIRGDTLQLGELGCALRSFEAARAQLRPGDNPELDMAINNNHAVALFFRGGREEGRKAARGQALRLLDISLGLKRDAAVRQQYAGTLRLLSMNSDALRGKNGRPEKQRRK